MLKNRILVVGAGFSGAVVARELAENAYSVDVIDQRNHVAGNCYTERDNETDVMVHKYGPHIFHTDDKEVWDYVHRYGEIKDYKNRVKTTVGGKVYSLPVNLHTINQFYNKALRPDEAKDFISKEADNSIEIPYNFEEQALRFIGEKLYKAFFKGYTIKQWGCDPKELPASILKRLPVRFNYEDNYFFHKFQGIPKYGYTQVVENMLTHKNISLMLGVSHQKDREAYYEHVFYTGAIDKYFDEKLGPLEYRTLDFDSFFYEGDYQGCAVMNFGDQQIPFTRITEYKHFTPWEEHEKSICFRETSRKATSNDIPYYPIRLVKEKELLSQYVDIANKQKNITFIGRLGTYRYLDMDITIREALDAANGFIASKKNNPPI